MMKCPECVSVMCTAPGTSAASLFWVADHARSMTTPKSGGVRPDFDKTHDQTAAAAPLRPMPVVVLTASDRPVVPTARVPALGIEGVTQHHRTHPQRADWA